MEEIILEGKMLSQMFSYGAYPDSPEFRSSELKGMMRNLYRMAYPASLDTLIVKESDLFGGMVGNARDDQGHASPIRLLIKSEGENNKKKLLCHNKTKNDPMYCPGISWKTNISISRNKLVTVRDARLAAIADLNWYKDLIILTLLLCGTGKRSRKGRGRVEITGRQFIDEAHALKWICTVLNRLAVTAGENYKNYYRISGNKIERKSSNAKGRQYSELRPTILKIWLGEKLLIKMTTPGSDESSVSCIDRYLKAVDEVCHKRKTPSSEKTQNEDPIGNGSPRFASSLLIGFIRIGEDIYPLYTFVKAVVTPRHKPPYEIDPFCKERELFIHDVTTLYNTRRNLR